MRKPFCAGLEALALLVCAVALLAASRPGAPAGDAVADLEEWFRLYRRGDERCEFFQDDELRALLNSPRLSAPRIADLDRLDAAYRAHTAVLPENAGRSSPADLIAAIRSSEAVAESRFRKQFQAYADFLEMTDLAAQEGSPQAVRLLLRIASHDYGRTADARAWQRVARFRPHLVRREARHAILRIPHDRALEPLLETFATTGKRVGPETHDAREVAAQLIAVITGREDLEGYQRFRLFETFFQLLVHGEHENTRVAAGLVLEALLGGATNLTVSDAKIEQLLELVTNRKSTRVAVAGVRVLRLLPRETAIRRLAEVMATGPELGRRVEDVILDTLDAITPITIGRDQERGAWLAWYHEQKDRPEFRAWLEQQGKPAPGPAEEGREREYADAPRFYGVPVVGQRVVFVIDTSGSMQDKMTPWGEATKIELARRELTATIHALAAETRFNIVQFNWGVSVFAPDFLRATAAGRERALVYVRALEASGSTNFHGGVTAALEVQNIGGRLGEHDGSVADQLIILSDGVPTCGITQDVEAIIGEIDRLNADRSVRIDTIAFGQDADRSFLKRLAEQNGGQMVEVITGG